MKTDDEPNTFGQPRATRAFIGTIIATLTLLGCAGDAPPPAATADAATSEQQAQAFVEALKPRRSGRPVIVMLARNEATETTDFLLPHALLQRADIADVHTVAPRIGPVTLYPTLQVEVAQDLAGFDKNYPKGADYVIVPAMDDADDPVISAWLQQQAKHGARIIGVCAGSLIVARAGLLDGRRFTSHWYFRDTLLERHPTAKYVPNQRYVIDGDIATTTGITASLPTMLALVESIGGRDKAQALAAELGMTSWNPAHDSSPFHLNAKRRVNFLLNKAAFWRDEQWNIDVQDGMDDITLALTADAWTRTGHVEVAATSPSNRVTLRSGVVLMTQPAVEGTPRVPLAGTLKPVQQLDRTLCEIGERYGEAQREWAMLELEYPGMSHECAPNNIQARAVNF
jgi:putative intracellular protease/amidase